MRKVIRLFVCILGLWGVSAHASDQQVKINSLYGEVIVNDPLMVALLKHPTIQRLKSLEVQGPSRYFLALNGYSVFDHAFGVYVLLKKFGAPRREQIAGLLRYVACTVFAEFGSFFFDTQSLDIFEVDTQYDFFEKTGLLKLLAANGVNGRELYPFNKDFKAIAPNPPDVSVGEIELILRLAFTYRMLSPKEIQAVIADLRYDDRGWYFVEESSAKRLASLSLYFAERFWGSTSSFVVNRWMAQALKRAIDLQTLNVNMLRFSTDPIVLRALMQTPDPLIAGNLMKARRPYIYFTIGQENNYDYLYKPPFRGLDPWVQTTAGLKRLTMLDKSYRENYERIRSLFERGFFLNTECLNATRALDRGWGPVCQARMRGREGRP